MEEKSKTEPALRQIETVTAAGEKAAIIALDPILYEDHGIGKRIIDKLESFLAPIRLVRERQSSPRGEIIQTLRDNDKVIIIDTRDETHPASKAPKSTPPDRSGESEINFPEVIYWSEELGIPPTVIFKGARQLDFSLENLMLELGYGQ